VGGSVGGRTEVLVGGMLVWSTGVDAGVGRVALSCRKLIDCQQIYFWT
jgi:hypothetical protein